MNAVRCAVWIEGDGGAVSRWYASVPRVGDYVLLRGVEHLVVRVRWPEGREATMALDPDLVVRRAS